MTDTNRIALMLGVTNGGAEKADFPDLCDGLLTTLRTEHARMQKLAEGQKARVDQTAQSQPTPSQDDFKHISDLGLG